MCFYSGDLPRKLLQELETKGLGKQWQWWHKYHLVLLLQMLVLKFIVILVPIPLLGLTWLVIGMSFSLPS